MTLEEAAELHLQFTERPGIDTGHKMSIFFALFSEEDGKYVGSGGREGIFYLYRNRAIKDILGWEYDLAGYQEVPKTRPSSSNSLSAETTSPNYETLTKSQRRLLRSHSALSVGIFGSKSMRNCSPTIPSVHPK